MKQTAKAIIRYPFASPGRIPLNSVVTVLDKVAVKNGKDAVYGLPGGTIERGETPEQALVREISEELGLKILKSTNLGSVGRHNLFLVDAITGVVDQGGIQSDEILGVGFLNSGRESMIPVDRLQGHVRHVIAKLMAPAVYPKYWPKAEKCGYKIRGYFFKGNTNRGFYDWQQQQKINQAGGRFNPNGW